MFYSIFVHFNIVSLRIKYKKDYICNIVKLFVQENITENRISKYIFERVISQLIIITIIYSNVYNLRFLIYHLSTYTDYLFQF